MKAVISTINILKVIPPLSNQSYKTVKNLKQKNEAVNHSIKPRK
jgi:hypothetical protein